MHSAQRGGIFFSGGGPPEAKKSFLCDEKRLGELNRQANTGRPFYDERLKNNPKGKSQEPTSPDPSPGYNQRGEVACSQSFE